MQQNVNVKCVTRYSGDLLQGVWEGESSQSNFQMF